MILWGPCNSEYSVVLLHMMTISGKNFICLSNSGVFELLYKKLTPANVFAAVSGERGAAPGLLRGSHFTARAELGCEGELGLP